MKHGYLFLEVTTTTGVHSMIEYFYRTSRGAVGIKFFDIDRARDWYQTQKNKHGKAMPDMELVKQTIEIKEEICEPFSSTTRIGRIAEQVPANASNPSRIQRMC